MCLILLAFQVKRLREVDIEYAERFSEKVKIFPLKVGAARRPRREVAISEKKLEKLWEEGEVEGGVGGAEGGAEAVVLVADA